jgi:hypothetical protein
MNSLNEQRLIEAQTVTHVRDGTVADIVSVTPGGQAVLDHHRDPGRDLGRPLAHPAAFSAIGEGTTCVSSRPRSWFRLAPIVAIPWARGGRVKVAAPDHGRGARSARNLDAAEHARTIAIGASAVTVAQQGADVLRTPATLCSRAGSFSTAACSEGERRPTLDKRRPGFGRRFRPQGRRSPLVSRPEGRPRANAEQAGVVGKTGQ